MPPHSMVKTMAMVVCLWLRLERTENPASYWQLALDVAVILYKNVIHLETIPSEECKADWHVQHRAMS